MEYADYIFLDYILTGVYFIGLMKSITDNNALSFIAWFCAICQTIKLIVLT